MVRAFFKDAKSSLTKQVFFCKLLMQSIKYLKGTKNVNGYTVDENNFRRKFHIGCLKGS